MQYTVIDPQGVYSNQVVTVPFEIDITKQSQHVVLANLAALKAIAIPRMYGCPIEDVDPAHVRDMFESVYVEGLETSGNPDHVLLIEQPDGTQVVGPGTLERMRAAAREHAAHKHQAEIEPIADDWKQNAVEAWWIEGTDVSYAIHKLSC